MGQGISILFPQLGMYDFGLAVKIKKQIGIIIRIWKIYMYAGTL